jgi:hypothetical protein
MKRNYVCQERSLESVNAIDGNTTLPGLSIFGIAMLAGWFA